MNVQQKNQNLHVVSAEVPKTGTLIIIEGKNFAFIKTSGKGNDVYVSRALLKKLASSVERPLKTGDLVDFREIKTPNGLAATFVAVVKDSKKEKPFEIGVNDIGKEFDMTLMWFNQEKGFGFLDLNGAGVFVHVTCVEKSGIRAVWSMAGKMFRVKIGHGRKKNTVQAVNLTPI